LGRLILRSFSEEFGIWSKGDVNYIPEGKNHMGHLEGPERGKGGKKHMR